MFNDVFSGNAFALTKLTASVNKLPDRPGLIGRMNLFEERGVPTRTVIIEEIDGILTLLNTKVVGAHGDQLNISKKRKVRNFTIPHIPFDDTILAASVQDVRQFGSEDQLQSVTTVVNDKMQDMKNAFETTMEYHRMGAITGVVLDADSSVIYDLRSEFGTGAELVQDFDFGTTDVIIGCIAARRLIETALGGDVGDFQVHCFCSSGFFDALIGASDVVDLYKNWLAAQTMRTDNRRGFFYGDIMFQEYNKTIDGVAFIAANEARLFPVNVTGLFIRRNGPADFIETVNTIGLPLYARQEVMEFNRGIKIHMQANPLHLCVRPECLIKGTIT